jgi:hypothetical protein
MKMLWILPLLLLAGCGLPAAPVAPVPAPGVYQVQVIARDAAGNQQSKTLTVTIVGVSGK